MPIARIVADVVREHAALAAFFWAQRDTLAQDDPPPDPAVIAGIDKRLEANLDGLRIAGTAAWRFIIEQYEDYPEKGELFVAAVTAIEQGDERRIEQLVQLSRTFSNARGLCGAFEWLPPKVSAPVVRAWIDAANPIKAEAAIAAFCAHGADPGDHLPRLLDHAAPRVRTAAARLAAVRGRGDCAGALRTLLHAPERSVSRAAAEALARLGHSDGDAVLKAQVLAMEEGWQRALRVLIGVTPDAEVRRWLSTLINTPETKVIAIRAAGMLGDGLLTGWLVDHLKTPAFAEAAGKALVELQPEFAANDDLWSMDPDVLGAGFATHFDGVVPLLAVHARVSSRLKGGAL